MTNPDPGFSFWSHGRHDKDLIIILGELRDEAEWRRRTGPDKVAKGRQTEMALQHDLNIIAELIADFEIAAGQRTYRQRGARLFGWGQKVNELRAIIMRRRNGDAQRVSKGQLNHADALRALTTLEAAHAWYWNKGLDFMDGATPLEIRDNIRAEYARREQWGRSQGYAYDPQQHLAIFTGDWSDVPKAEQRELEAAE